MAWQGQQRPLAALLRPRRGWMPSGRHEQRPQLPCGRARRCPRKLARCSPWGLLRARNVPSHHLGWLLCGREGEAGRRGRICGWKKNHSATPFGSSARCQSREASQRECEACFWKLTALPGSVLDSPLRHTRRRWPPPSPAPPAACPALSNRGTAGSRAPRTKRHQRATTNRQPVLTEDDASGETCACTHAHRRRARAVPPPHTFTHARTQPPTAAAERQSLCSHHSPTHTTARPPSSRPHAPRLLPQLQCATTYPHGRGRALCRRTTTLFLIMWPRLQCTPQRARATRSGDGDGDGVAAQLLLLLLPSCAAPIATTASKTSRRPRRSAPPRTRAAPCATWLQQPRPAAPLHAGP